jgi:hypothetical protein
MGTRAKARTGLCVRNVCVTIAVALLELAATTSKPSSEQPKGRPLVVGFLQIRRAKRLNPGKHLRNRLTRA